MAEIANEYNTALASSLESSPANTNEVVVIGEHAGASVGLFIKPASNRVKQSETVARRLPTN